MLSRAPRGHLRPPPLEHFRHTLRGARTRPPTRPASASAQGATRPQPPRPSRAPCIDRTRRTPSHSLIPTAAQPPPGSGRVPHSRPCTFTQAVACTVFPLSALVLLQSFVAPRASPRSVVRRAAAPTKADHPNPRAHDLRRRRGLAASHRRLAF
ncbi:MAG: hypothetical protein J3K34DRAFT_436093 [Monoraphidium minutum]|nr:MAG: hypothetical protein J3K34DRAFT_436093 [Monoraphidium minutum]